MCHYFYDFISIKIEKNSAPKLNFSKQACEIIILQNSYTLKKYLYKWYDII